MRWISRCRMFCLLSKFTLHQQLSPNRRFGTTKFYFTSFKVLRLLQNLVISENHGAREYPNTTAMGVALLSKSFLYSENECGLWLRCQNGIGGWRAVFTRISVAWLGRICPVPAESPDPRGKRRGSDDSAPIGPTNVAQSF